MVLGVSCVIASFTMLPPFIHGLFEKDISEELIEAHPKTCVWLGRVVFGCCFHLVVLFVLALEFECCHTKLAVPVNMVFRSRMRLNRYRYTQSRAPFRLSVYLLWLLNALWHSVAIYYGCEFAFAGEILGDSVEGREASFWGFSLLCSTVTVFVVLLKAALITKHWVIFDHIVIWGSMAVYLFIIWLYTLMDISPYIKGVLADEVFSPLGMLTIVGVTVGALLPDFALAAYTRWYKPHDWEVLRVRVLLCSRCCLFALLLWLTTARCDVADLRLLASLTGGCECFCLCRSKNVKGPDPSCRRDDDCTSTSTACGFCVDCRLAPLGMCALPSWQCCSPTLGSVGSALAALRGSTCVGVHTIQSTSTHHS